MIIGVDLDSTLIETNAVNVAARELGFPITNKDTLHWGHLNFPTALRKRVHEYFLDADLMCTQARPIEGAQEAIRNWKSQGHTIVVITARGDALKVPTREMVSRLFPEIDDVNFVEMDTTKIGVMRAKGVELWVDDAPHGAMDAIGEDIPTYLISNNYTKYNWHIRHQPKLRGVVKTVADIRL